MADGNYFFYYLPLKDTLYYFGNEYIEVNLSKQLAFYITRRGEIDTIKVSSGNKFLSGAIETPTGLYAVQNKAPIQISRQFENTEMINWIGFNGNIGFHSLKKTGYYWRLGRIPSSHGCIRISNEDGVKLYQKVRIGIPVLVYFKEPARSIRFASFKEFNINHDVFVDVVDRRLASFLNERIIQLSKGNLFRFGYKKIFIGSRLKIKYPFIMVEKPTVTVNWQKPTLWFRKDNVTENLSLKVSNNLFYLDTYSIRLR